MIRDELVQHIHLVGIVIVIKRSVYVVEESRLAQVIANIFDSYLLNRLAQCLLPKTVGFGKECEAIVAVSGNGTSLTDRGVIGQVLDLIGLIKVFPSLVTIGVERVFHMASQQQTRHYGVPTTRLLCPHTHKVAQTSVARSNHSLNLMNISVSQHDAPVLL